MACPSRLVSSVRSQLLVSDHHFETLNERVFLGHVLVETLPKVLDSNLDFDGTDGNTINCFQPSKSPI